MWHEARRQEKAVRHKMVDNVKRHERRKQFYESVRREPEEFMQVHGQKIPIHVDPSIAEAAESPNILRKWQGDPNILIDRFDVRVHLEQIQEAPPKQAKTNLLKDDVEELQCEYERYRILVFNEFNKLSEASSLAQIAAKEFWPNQSNNSSTYKKEQEKKRKMVDQRAAIAFSYGDSETVRANPSGRGRKEQQQSNDTSSSDDDELDEPEEMDPVLNPDELTAEQAAALNKIGTKFSVTSGAFLQLLNLDRNEQTSTAQIKEIDKAKLALSGRHAKADRAVLKRRRAMIIGSLGNATQNSEEATTTLLSFLATTHKADLKEESSSSDSGEEFVKTEFITCFGGDDEKSGRKTTGGEGVDEDETGGGGGDIVHGPVLPTKEYRRLLELSKRKSASPESQWDERTKEGRERQRSSRHRRSSSRSPVRRRRKSRSHSSDRNRRDSSQRRHSRNYRRRNSSPSPKRGHYSSSSRKGIGSQHKERYSRDSSTKRHQKCNEKQQKTVKEYKDEQQQKKLSPKQQFSPSGTSSSEESDNSLLSVHSSMSESEKERVERENRKRRIRRTKRVIKEQQNSRPAESQNQEQEEIPVESKAEKAAKKLRTQMQKAIRKTAAQLKEEEKQRQREALQEKKRRDEEFEEVSRQLRQREREKRRAEDKRERRRESAVGKNSRSTRRRRQSSSRSGSD